MAAALLLSVFQTAPTGSLFPDMENQTDHDLLIIISQDSKWIKEWAINHEKNDAAMNSETKAIAKAAHSRLDKMSDHFNWLVISGILAICLFGLSIVFKKG